MIAYLQQFINNFKQPKNWLVLANIFLVFFLIVLGNTGVIPLQMGDFVFFSILALAFALWRPGWAFLFFCGTIPLENINLAPLSLGLTIRPYQFISAILVIAILARLISGRLNFQLAKLKIPDYFVILMTIGGVLGTFFSPNKLTSLKLEIIFITFVILYFLVRNYIQNINDVKKTIPFFLSSSIVITLYGLWQNIAYLHGVQSFEVMPGRPNATFTEADWLGMFLVVAISIIYSLLYYRYFERGGTESKNLQSNAIINEQLATSSTTLRMTELFTYSLLATLYIILILTVSRSAWLAALLTYVIFILIFFTELKFKNWRWRETSILKLKIILTLILAILIVHAFQITNFQLGNRVQSTATGLQKITLACDNEIALPESIKDVSELAQYGCKFINLEDITTEQMAGRFVTEIYRSDPNVNVRADIYQKSWVEIKNHPIFGIGWGSIGSVLGSDGRGTALNSSNIFLEAYLGAGIIGILGLMGLLGLIIFNAIVNFFHAQSLAQKTFFLFLIISWFGIVIFNLFNAGILLGFLWFWFAVAQVKD